MYIGILIRLLIGYVRVEVEGYYIEKFINMCVHKKIFIWNLKREKGVKLFLNIGKKDFKKLREICKQTRCKIKIQKKKGIPFILYKYKKRKIFVIFLIIISIVIYSSSKYVWNIDINVEDNLEVENIRDDLYNLGLKKGMKKENIDADKIINEIRLQRDDISWIGMDIKGTNVRVKIVKADDTPELLDNKDYCNIVAKKNGIITKITAQNGTAMVKVGDTVQKGEVLIAGYMEGKYTEPRYLHSLRRSTSKSMVYRKRKSLL